MRTPFGARWEEVNTAQVREFLAEGSDESLTWEAKGERIHRHAVRRAASAFGNSRNGGFLIVGASRDARRGPWRLAGVQPVSDEPLLWLASVIRDGVDPVPAFDLRALEVDAPGRWGAIVRLEPVPTPPCITIDGEVYERVSGESRPVRDAGALERLFARGDRARSNAKERALATLARGAELGGDRYEVDLVLCMAPYEQAPDTRLRIFRADGSDDLRGVLLQHLSPSQSFGIEDHGAVQQHSLVVSLHNPHDQEATWLHAAESGAVAVGRSSLIRARAQAVIDEGWLVGAWEAAAASVRLLGGHDPAYLVATLSDAGGGSKVISIEKWLDVLEPEDYAVASVRREVRRAQGHLAVEPPPLERPSLGS